MIDRISFLLLTCVLILPVALITGPAIPDIIITFSGIFFLFLILFKNEYKIIFKKKIFIISILFWIYLVFISFFSENKFLAFRDSLIFIRYLFLPLFIYFWITNDIKNLKRILLIILICIIFVTLDTLYQFFQYSSENGFGKDLLGFQSNWYGRLTGPFGDELIPGAYLTRFAFLGFVFILLTLKKNKYKNIFSIMYFSLIGFAIFASGERMALATYLMGLSFLIIFSKDNRKIFFISLIITILFIPIIKKIHLSYNDFKIIESTPYHLGLKVEKEFKCTNESLNKCKKIIRLQPNFVEVIKNFNKSAYGEIYQLSFKMFQDNKITGIGLNNFTYLCENDARYNKVIKNYVCVSHPHNIYIQWLVETGMIGLILFIIYLFYLSYFILKKNYNEFSLISFVSILVIFWPIMSTGSLLKNWNGVSIFFIIGLSLALTKIKTGD